ncbi:MAG: LptF/LptG family permease, partial [Pseudomonadota bacterium]
AFARWWAATDPAPEPGGRVWFRAGMDVAGGRVGDLGRRLDEVEIYRRDASGGLTWVVRAPAALWRDGGWWLPEAELRVPGAPAVAFAAVRWPATVPPDNLMQLTRRQPVLSTAALRAILAGAWAGDQAPDVYRLRLIRSYAQPVMPLVMILLATPVAGGLRRSGGIPAGMAVGLAAGLSYLLLDGILAALGEAGLLPPLMAAWLAHAVFASLGGAMLLHAEG